MSKTLWFRYGHVEGIKVSVGEKVKKGQILAVVADQADNGGWSPHLHFDCYQVAQVHTAYTKGMSFEKFSSIYLDPRTIISQRGYATPTGIPDSSCRWGFKHAEWAKYPSASMFHPGWDYNWGSGSLGEVGKPVFAVADGVVEFVSSDKNRVGTWGGLVVIKVTTEEEDMGRIEELEAIVRDVRAENNDLKRDRDAKIDEVANLKTDIGKISADYQASQRLVESLQKDVQRLQEQLSTPAQECPPERVVSSFSAGELFNALISKLFGGNK